MIYRWKLGRDIKKTKILLNKIKPKAKLELDVGIISKLSGEEFYAFRRNLWELISMLRNKQISVNYNAIRLESIKHGVVLLGPHTLELNISTKCNYHCAFCIIHSPVTERISNISSVVFVPFKNIKNFIDQAYIMGTETINICGEGEPLLHPEILKIIRYINKYNFEIIIMTNASRGDVLANIAKVPFSTKRISFLINLSAINAEKFVLLYGKPPSLFKKVLDNIKKISHRYSCMLSYLVLKNNYTDISGFTNLASTLGAKSVIFKFPNLYESAQKEKLALSRKDMNIFLHKIAKIKSLAKKYHISIELTNGLLNHYLQRARKIQIRRCYNGWFVSKIKENGDIYTCCIENKPLGKIHSGNFVETFFSPSAVSYLLEGRRGINLNSEKWRKCRFCAESRRNLIIDTLVRCH